MCLYVTIAPGAPLLPLKPFNPVGPFLPDVPGPPGSPCKATNNVTSKHKWLCVICVHVGLDCMYPPYHLLSQQPRVNRALQVLLVTLGDLCPQLGQALLICPGTNTCESHWVTCINTNIKHMTGEISFQWFTLLNSPGLTCGPTTPVGPGGPVFPSNPCKHKQ